MSFLNLVDLVGSQERYTRYVNSVKNVLPTAQRKEANRYWSMFAQIMQTHANSAYVTDKNSIISCMFNAPKLGLNPDPVYGHIYFVPYKGKLTYQIGYKGMIQLSLNTGKVVNVSADLVFEKDEFDYYVDEKGKHYLHRQCWERDRGREICGYSVFTDNNYVPHIHMMESYHIDDIKEMVLARMKGSKTPWLDKVFEPEMRKKTVIRRHWKTEPMSSEIAQVISHEENNEAGNVISKEENDKIIDEIMESGKALDDDYPDPNSPEGKKLAAELDAKAAGIEQTR